MAKAAIEAAKSKLELVEEMLVDEAEDAINEYWIEWRLMNKKLAKAERNDTLPKKYQRGNVAPRITVRTRKPYIEWVIYAPGRYGGRKKNWGKRITPRRGPVYRMSQFYKITQKWEFELIEQTENRVRPLRYAIEYIHGSIAYLNRLLSKM